MNRMISDLPDLVQRVEKLEKANRRLKLAGVLALTLVGCLLLLGAASPKRTVEAEEFVLRDANGDERARLGITASGSALGFRDANGNLRAVLSTKGGLILYDAKGDMRLSLGDLPGGAALLLKDANGVSRVMLSVFDAGATAGLLLYDANGKVAVLVAVSPRGRELKLLDANGKLIFSAPDSRTWCGSRSSSVSTYLG